MYARTNDHKISYPIFPSHVNFRICKEDIDYIKPNLIHY